MDTVWLVMLHVLLVRTQPLAAPAQHPNSSVNHYAHQIVWMDTMETQSHTDVNSATQLARPAHQEEKTLACLVSQDSTYRTTFVFKTVLLEPSPQTESAPYAHLPVLAVSPLRITAHLA